MDYIKARAIVSEMLIELSELRKAISGNVNGYDVTDEEAEAIVVMYGEHERLQQENASLIMQISQEKGVVH